MPLNLQCPVNLIGKKVENPLINVCRSCHTPILQYGRIIPCKHCLCVGCVETIQEDCPICSQKYTKIEQNAVVFVCPFPTMDNKICERSYLSERDLVAHLKTRHQNIDHEKFSAGTPIKFTPREEYVKMAVPEAEPVVKPISAISQDIDYRGDMFARPPFHQNQNRFNAPYNRMQYRPDFRHHAPRGRGGYRPRNPFRQNFQPTNSYQ